MSRFRSNCRVMLLEPMLLVDVISVTPAMRVNCFSSGVATDEAMVSGLAPGSCADTEMVGKSTCGSGDTGRERNEIMPDKATAAVRSAVPTGLWMKGADTLMSAHLFLVAACGAETRLDALVAGHVTRPDESGRGRHERESALWAVSSGTNHRRRSRRGRPQKTMACPTGRCLCLKGLRRRRDCVVSGECLRHVRPAIITGPRGNMLQLSRFMFRIAREGPAQFVEVQVDHGRGVQRQQLADDQAADDGDAQRLAQFGAVAVPERQRQAAKAAPRGWSS